jgi:hypothetical protein
MARSLQTWAMAIPWASLTSALRSLEMTCSGVCRCPGTMVRPLRGETGHTHMAGGLGRRGQVTFAAYLLHEVGRLRAALGTGSLTRQVGGRR